MATIRARTRALFEMKVKTFFERSILGYRERRIIPTNIKFPARVRIPKSWFTVATIVIYCLAVGIEFFLKAGLRKVLL